MSQRAKLYWNPICPFVQRAWIAALEKNADIDYEFIALGDDKPAWYEKEVNPAGTVPTLRTADGKLVFESEFVSQYFDEHYGVPGALQPGTPETKYRARKFIEQSSNVIGPLYQLLMSPLNGERTDELKKQVREKMQKLDEKFVSEKLPGGPYYFGSNFSYADISILPFFLRFRATLSAYHNFDIFATAPNLKNYTAEAETRPSVSASLLPPNSYVNSYRGYAKREPFGTELKLYVNKNPFSKSVQIAAALKGLKVDVISLDSDADCPFEDVPALEVSPSFHLTGSTFILQYLDETYRQGQDARQGVLFPTDTQAAHDTRFLAGYLRDQLGEASFQIVDGDNYGENPEETKTGLKSGLKAVDALFTRGGPYFLGKEPSFADVANIPLTQVVRNAFRKSFPDEKFEVVFPNLGTWLEAAAHHPVFALHSVPTA